MAKSILDNYEIVNKNGLVFFRRKMMPASDHKHWMRLLGVDRMIGSAPVYIFKCRHCGAECRYGRGALRRLLSPGRPVMEWWNS